MSEFIYEATNKQGFTVHGEYEAKDKKTVVEFLRKKNLIPISVQSKHAGVKGQLLSLTLFENITFLDRVLLIRNLSAAIKAGLSITESLDILIADSTKKIVRDILIQARVNLQNGQPLSATFKYYNKYFPPIFVGIILAGETSGELDKALEELNDYLVREHDLSIKVKSAMAYPVLLLIASVGIVLLLLVFVLPKLQKTFLQSNVELPALTQFLLDVSALLTYSPFLDLMIFGGLTGFILYFRKTLTGKRLFSRVLFHLPVVNSLIKKLILVRFTKTLSSVTASGIPILEGLQLASESVSNPEYKAVILECREQVTHGIPLSQALSKYPKYFPNFLTSLTKVGEKTGTLENILKTFADFYSKEVDHNLKTVTTFIEPILLLIMGLIVGLIALSILLPIYQLVGSFA